MLDKKDKAAIAGITATGLITNLVWIVVFIQHHREWKQYCDKLTNFYYELNDRWYKVMKAEEEETE